MQIPLPCYDNLEASLAEAWARLARGVKDRRSAFHTPVLASVGADGVPQVRTLVLRAADPVAWRLRFHTPDTQVSREAYARSQEKSRVCYAQALSPGTQMQGPDDAGRIEGGADNFSVIEIAVERLEWLYLHADGHRRAEYTRTGGALSATWIAP